MSKVVNSDPTLVHHVLLNHVTCKMNPAVRITCGYRFYHKAMLSKDENAYANSAKDVDPDQTAPIGQSDL